MGKGYYSFNFASEAARSMVWEMGSVVLRPGVLRLELWEPRTLFEIAHGIEVLVNIDQNTLDRKFGLFVRVLVDIDLSYDPPRELAVCHKNGETVIIEAEYERLPDLCSHCGNIGHRVTACKLVQKKVGLKFS
ncbi:uncharacterized protein LOC133744452 [Rosa rugosa]|uniref:uncharacterized protein LOC133744452 n=1 Tax=Rosa rugosa TaxID=74645 RepID=UPI002B40AB51|nr:uncharacterized protein LOC133744452 [Rosa rugosa]